MKTIKVIITIVTMFIAIGTTKAQNISDMLNDPKQQTEILNAISQNDGLIIKLIDMMKDNERGMNLMMEGMMQFAKENPTMAMNMGMMMMKDQSMMNTMMEQMMQKASQDSSMSMSMCKMMMENKDMKSMMQNMMNKDNMVENHIMHNDDHKMKCMDKHDMMNNGDKMENHKMQNDKHDMKDTDMQNDKNDNDNDSKDGHSMHH